MANALRCALALVVLFVTPNPAVAQNRSALLPHLHPGQTLTYQIRLRIDKQVRSESRVAAPIIPAPEPVDIVRTMRVEVLDVAPDNLRALLVLRVQIVDPAAKSSSPAAKPLEFSVRSDGSVLPPKDAQELSPQDAQAWQSWLARFAVAWTIPEKGVKPGDKWRGEESITGTPLARLSWQKESRYVREERCPGAQSADERCGVLLTTAVLKQRSSPKNATPGDFQLRQLKTKGTAKGRNEIFTYISLSTGLVLRSTEEAHQSMDVIIAKADGSNRVHYSVEAASSTEMLLFSESAVAH